MELLRIEADDLKWWIKLPDIMSGSLTFENILSISVLEWLVILFGCKIKSINELEVRDSKNSFF